MEEPVGISQYYQEDHDRLDGLFKEFQREKAAGSKQAAGSFEAFASGLLRHIAWEEEVLFPCFEEKTGLKGTGPTEVMRIEHREIRHLLRAIHEHLRQGRSSGSEEAALLEVLSEHNCKEERILYPAIDEQLSPQERREVFARMKGITGKKAADLAAEGKT